MPIPVDIADVDTITASNSPAGTDAIGTSLDDYIRVHAAFIAQLRNGSKNLQVTSAGAPALAFLGDPNTGISSSGSDQIGLSAGGAEFRNAAGVWTNPSNTQPSFRALASASRSTAGSFVTYNSEAYDQGSVFDASNGIFLVPVAGIYIFSYLVYGSTAGASAVNVGPAVGGTSTGDFVIFDPSLTTYKTGSAIMRLSASDSVTMLASGASGTWTSLVSIFSGHLLG